MKRLVALLSFGFVLGLAPGCSTLSSWVSGQERIPKKLDAARVPHAIESARDDLAQGRTERALTWMRAASASTGLSPETRDEVQKLLEDCAARRIDELSVPDADPEDLADLVDIDLPRQLAVTAGIRAARRMFEEDEPMDGYHLVKRLDTKYPLHHERVAAGELLADIGLALSKDHSSFLFFFDRQDDAQEVLEYLILNYPRASRCDQAYAALSRIYADDRQWWFAIDRLEKLVLSHPQSTLRPEAQAGIPKLRLASIESPEYDRSALLRARREMEEWLRAWPTHELEPRVRADLTDCLRRLADSDRNIAGFYVRVDNPSGARWHAQRSIEEARAAGDENRAREAREILDGLPPEKQPASAPLGSSP